MNGCVIPGTSIAVDFWQVRSHGQSGIKLFFLTHLHGDHMVGLTSTWRQPIYCSPITARLLMERYGLDQSIVRSLEVGQSHLIGYCQGNCVQSASDSQGKNSQYNGLFKSNSGKHRCDLISVTVIDASHCAGSVMFLFEGPFGKILHTGDFRFSPEMFEEGSLLSKHIGTIDTVYLDNTYCSPRCTFPSRSEALNEIVDIVKSHSSHDIVFGVRNLGKEELLAAVALAVGDWINVPPSTMSFVQSLGLPDVFQTGNPGAHLRVVPFHTISSEYVRHLNLRKSTIIILPTALYQGICGKPYCNTPEVFVIPYSDHSSYPELLQFVSTLRPVSVKPIVQGKMQGPFGVDLSCRVDMTCFQQYLTKPQSVHSATPSCSKPSTHCSSMNSFCGFEDLFPDMKGPLRKKQSIKKRSSRSKPLCSKGVNYFSDDETDEVCSQEKTEINESRALCTQNSLTYEQTNTTLCEQVINTHNARGSQGHCLQKDDGDTNHVVLDNQEKAAGVLDQTSGNVSRDSMSMKPGGNPQCKPPKGTSSREEVCLQTVVEREIPSQQIKSVKELLLICRRSKSNHEHIRSLFRVAPYSCQHKSDLVKNLYENICTSTSTQKSAPMKTKTFGEKDFLFIILQQVQNPS